MVLRGNYSQHNYPHRFSEGENFQLDGDGFLAEHNVIRSSSWPVRGMGGELRYNLIDASGNSDQVLQGPMSNANIHHNIFSFTVSQTLYSPGAGLRLIYNVDNVQFHNNVMDGGGAFMGFAGKSRSRSPVARSSEACETTCSTISRARPVDRSWPATSTNRRIRRCRGFATPITTISTTPTLPTRRTMDWEWLE